MTKAEESFLKAIETYLNSNDFRPENFKLTLLNYPNSPRNISILEGFKIFLEKKSITPETWEGLTNSLIDTQEEVDLVIRALWKYVYEDGDAPNWQES